jgi:hypothetical protein
MWYQMLAGCLRCRRSGALQSRERIAIRSTGAREHSRPTCDASERSHDRQVYGGKCLLPRPWGLVPFNKSARLRRKELQRSNRCFGNVQVTLRWRRQGESANA